MLDSLEECNREPSHLVTAPEPVFPFCIQIDNSAGEIDNSAGAASLTVIAKNLLTSTQYKERARMTERQRQQADRCITKIRQTFRLKKVAQDKQKVSSKILELP